MPRVTANAVASSCNAFRRELDRAAELHDRIAGQAGTVDGNGVFHRLLQPDRRDVAQFVFFEAAASFEAFVQHMFSVEVRSRFGVTYEQSFYLMGTSDKGVENVMGWGAPGIVVERAANVMGARGGFHAHLKTALGSAKYDCLVHAHAVRNRIAHGQGAKSFKHYMTALTWGGVPTGSRNGCGPGRFLHDYPAPTAGAGKTILHEFLVAYGAYADGAQNTLP